MNFGGDTQVNPANPAAMAQMMQMMQMMQLMSQGVGGQMADPSAQPFTQAAPSAAIDPGLEADLVRPGLLTNLVREQQPLPLQAVLDVLCLTPDGFHSLGGIPKGCTMALAGPPGKGKTRSSLEGMLRVAKSGVKCLYVVAEEGFLDEVHSGRDPLASRLVKLGMQMFLLNEQELAEQVLSNITVLQAQYHKGQSWDDFVVRYRYAIEREDIKFVVVDSLNMLDPSKARTAENLGVLKTYNHEKGVTCLTIGQIRDSGQPVGGEAMMHTADVVFMLEEMSMGSKEMGAVWGANYRDVITVIRAVKSVTTPIFPHPIRVEQSPDLGTLRVHASQPEAFKPFPTL